MYICIYVYMYACLSYAHTQVTELQTHIHARDLEISQHMKRLHELDQCVANNTLVFCTVVCCSVLQCVVLCCSVLQCVAVCCSVLQCVAVCCSVLQCAAVCCTCSAYTSWISVLPATLRCTALLCVAVCCSVLQWVAVSCSELQ